MEPEQTKKRGAGDASRPGKETTDPGAKAALADARHRVFTLAHSDTPTPKSAPGTVGAPPKDLPADTSEQENNKKTANSIRAKKGNLRANSKKLAKQSKSKDKVAGKPSTGRRSLRFERPDKARVINLTVHVPLALNVQQTPLSSPEPSPAGPSADKGPGETTLAAKQADKKNTAPNPGRPQIPQFQRPDKAPVINLTVNAWPELDLEQKRPVPPALSPAEPAAGKEPDKGTAAADTGRLKIPQFERPDKAPVIHLTLDARPEPNREPKQQASPALSPARLPADKTSGEEAPVAKQAGKKPEKQNIDQTNSDTTKKEFPFGKRHAQTRHKKRHGRAVRYTLRSLGALGMVLCMTLLLAFGSITMVCLGPFPTAKELFVVSVNETSAVKFLSRLYFSAEEVEQILQNNAVLMPNEVTNTARPFTANENGSLDEIEIVEVSGSTYKGKMMIVHDPSRIQLATLPQFGLDEKGKRIEDFVSDAGAVGGVNAGGFADEGGVGKGGMPLGLVIHEGQIVSGYASTECNLIGFDDDNRLVVGTMSGAQALEMGVRDAVHFEPTLIVNGNPAEVSGTGGGLNPRTVIGQRADGAVLLLVIDGRQPHSVGATLQDCLQEMLDFGAVNAANLDGGSSSMMIYEDEVINVCASLSGSRNQPAAWLVV